MINRDGLKESVSPMSSMKRFRAYCVARMGLDRGIPIGVKELTRCTDQALPKIGLGTHFSDLSNILLKGSAFELEVSD